jgi:hypothetical protein
MDDYLHSFHFATLPARGFNRIFFFFFYRVLTLAAKWNTQYMPIINKDNLREG